MENDITDRIRDAIASEEYGAALRLWNDYAGLLRGELSRGELSAERMAATRELFEWSRSVLVCARAHMVDRLNALHAAGVYAAQAAGQSSLSRTSF
ncbi:MAG TPA: hypothetical protein VFE56_09860 [Candidatus Binataceae bacterium]|nr:hypothetical protein [Candidatus Binataceae bacterium]